MLATPANQTSNSTDLSQSGLTLECRHSDLAPLLLTPGKWTVGSGSDNSLAIDADGVAKRHCLIVASEKRTLLKSWQPDTFVNGEAVTDIQIKHGDRIRIGTVEFDVRAAGDAELISQLPCVTQVDPAELRKHAIDADTVVSEKHSAGDQDHSDRPEIDRASVESLPGRVDDLLEVTSGLADELAGADVDEERLDLVIDRIQSSLRADETDDRTRDLDQLDESSSSEDSTPTSVDTQFDDPSVSAIAHELGQLRESIHALVVDCGVDPSRHLADRVESESSATSDVRLCIALLQECSGSLKSRSEAVETSSIEVETEQSTLVSEQSQPDPTDQPEHAAEPEPCGSLFESIMSADPVEGESADGDADDDLCQDDSSSPLIDDAPVDLADDDLEADKDLPVDSIQDDLSDAAPADLDQDDRLFTSDRRKLENLMEQFELDATVDELHDEQIAEEEEAVGVGAPTLLAEDSIQNALRSRSEAVRQLDELVLAATAAAADESTISDGTTRDGIDRVAESGHLFDEQPPEPFEGEEASEEHTENEPAGEDAESIASVDDDQTVAISMLVDDEAVDAGIETVDEVPWSIQSETDTWTEGTNFSAEIDEVTTTAEVDTPEDLEGHDQWIEETNSERRLDSYLTDEPLAIDSSDHKTTAAAPAGESSLLASLFRPENSDERGKEIDESSTEEPADQSYLIDEEEDDDDPSRNLVRSQLAEMFDLPDSNDSNSLLNDPDSERSLDERFESFFEGCESSSRESNDDSQTDGRYLSSSTMTPEGNSGSTADDANDTDPEMSSYMEQLLARSRKKAGLDSAAGATPDEQTESRPNSTIDQPSNEGKDNPRSEVVPGQPAEWFAQEPRHRQNKEKIRAEVQALREVANDSARAAVGSASRRDLRIQVLAKTGATVVALGCGLGALTLELPLIFAYFVIGIGVLFTGDLARTIVANWNMISKLDLVSGNDISSSTSSNDADETTDQAD